MDEPESGEIHVSETSGIISSSVQRKPLTSNNGKVVFMPCSEWNL